MLGVSQIRNLLPEERTLRRQNISFAKPEKDCIVDALRLLLGDMLMAIQLSVHPRAAKHSADLLTGSPTCPKTKYNVTEAMPRTYATMLLQGVHQGRLRNDRPTLLRDLDGLIASCAKP